MSGAQNVSQTQSLATIHAFTESVLADRSNLSNKEEKEEVSIGESSNNWLSLCESGAGLAYIAQYIKKKKHR